MNAAEARQIANAVLDARHNERVTHLLDFVYERVKDQAAKGNYECWLTPKEIHSYSTPVIEAVQKILQGQDYNASNLVEVRKERADGICNATIIWA